MANDRRNRPVTDFEETTRSSSSGRRREKTYTTGPLPQTEGTRTRRAGRSNPGGNVERDNRTAGDPMSQEMAEREARRERRRLRREYERWRTAHRIVRILILLVLILDILILRFGVFSGGFLPVWNVITASRNSSAETAGSNADVTIDLEINEQLLTVNEYSRPGTELKEVNGIVIHYIGNPGTDAQANRDYFEGLKDGTADTYASCHYIIGLDGTVIQCVPDNEVAYASSNRNVDTISIECCHPDESGAFTEETFSSLVKLTAQLCREYNLSTDEVIRHYDVDGKPCPLYFVNDADGWTNFLASVQTYL